MKKLRSIFALLLALLLIAGSVSVGVVHTHASDGEADEHHQHHEQDEQHDNCAACVWQSVTTDSVAPAPVLQFFAVIGVSIATPDYFAPISEPFSYALEHAPPVGC